MLQSMTGYGRATARGTAGGVTVELRSTNHRFIEIEPRLPNGCVSLHGELAELIRRYVQRGRIELTVGVRSEAREKRRVTFDPRLIEGYYSALKALKRRLRLAGEIRLEHMLALPQAVKIADERLPDVRLTETIRRTAEAAVRELVRSRRREGARLVADLRAQLHEIHRHLRAVKARLPLAGAQQQDELRRRLQGLLGPGASGTPSQLEQVIALVKEADVHEELVRLSSHLGHMEQAITGGGLVGKRLDFFAQELMREANTLGAKVHDPQAVRHVVEMKGCIEKIREQAQNLE